MKPAIKKKIIYVEFVSSDKDWSRHKTNSISKDFKEYLDDISYINYDIVSSDELALNKQSGRFVQKHKRFIFEISFSPDDTSSKNQFMAETNKLRQWIIDYICNSKAVTYNIYTKKNAS